MWWGKTEKPLTKVGDEFTVNFGDDNWSFRVTEFKPNTKLTWECIGGNAEWIGDTLYWNIEKQNDKVKISLLQNGLTPDMNCYELSLSEGLEILLQAEQEDRDNRRFERLKKSAKFRYSATIEELRFEASRGIGRSQITELAMGTYLSKGESILITGATWLR